MKITTSFIISLIVLIIGVALKAPILWLPVSVLIASLIDMPTRSWVMSNRLGSAQTVSMAFKGTLSLVGIYAMLGQVVCLGLLVYWFVR